MEMYVLGALISFILGWILRMPLFPRDKFSFEPTALFPTVPLTLGFLAVAELLLKLNLFVTFSISLAVPLFVKYLLNNLCPVVEA
jgi:energy-converting hydrogenase Eha subunit A